MSAVDWVFFGVAGGGSLALWFGSVLREAIETRRRVAAYWREQGRIGALPGDVAMLPEDPGDFQRYQRIAQQGE